jgi:hypothetical protein
MKKETVIIVTVVSVTAVVLVAAGIIIFSKGDKKKKELAEAERQKALNKGASKAEAENIYQATLKQNDGILSTLSSGVSEIISGDAPLRFDTNKAVELYKSKGGTTYFTDSLMDVLNFAQNDKTISSVDRLAYLLATAKAESDYSLQRWESDYKCGKSGVPYKVQPCEKAIGYYKSTDGKKNYFTLGTDSRGMAYFGRGLIQLTGKDNYKKYGDLIGVDLVSDGDKALIPKNSYSIASTYLNNRTWKHLDKGDLTGARKSVNGGTKGVGEVNKYYEMWKGILYAIGATKNNK